ncbi:GNAT family N-acetyltransferase [Blastomonas sp.]|uniref:GNAT family N-acetyltransferase n=1 Tax=Blastomonas sp. TaxID=1909299 RepID=UPI003593F7BD
MSEFQIIPLDQVDSAWVEELLDRVFGADRTSRPIYKVREGMEALPALSFAALDGEGWLVGSIQCWPVALHDPDGMAWPMILVGPVGVAPDHQDQGIGRALMAAVFGALGVGEKIPLVLLGDPDYYGVRFGFSTEKTGSWSLPGPYEQHRLMALQRPDSVMPPRGVLGPWRAQQR